MRHLFLLLALSVLLASPAPAVVLSIDSSQSTITPTVGGVETLSGTIQVVLGDPLPLVANTTFDVQNLSATWPCPRSWTSWPALCASKTRSSG